MNGMEQGLGAIAPGMSTPPGMPRLPEQRTGVSRQSMQEIMSVARQMSDAQLADVLMGRSMEIPQFAAMSEAMGRKQLRTAMQGAQAQQQVQQPSLKDQFLADAGMIPPMMAQPQMRAQGQPQQAMLPEEQGIGALPAPNMDQMGMADGGIVAFNQGGMTPGQREQWNALRKLALVGDVAGLPLTWGLTQVSGRRVPLTDWKFPEIYTEGLFPLSDRVSKARAEAHPQQFSPGTKDLRAPVIMGPEGLPIAVDEKGREIGIDPEETEAETAAEAEAAAEAAAEAEAARAAQARAPAAAQAPVQEVLEAPATEDRFAQFASDREGLEKTLDQQRRESQGEFLMQIGASLLTSPTIAQGLGEGVQQAMPFLVANKREANKLRQDARDFEFNVARAQQAAEQGDRALALEYEKLAAQKAYQTGMLAAKNAAGGEDKMRKLIFEQASKNRAKALENFAVAQQYEKMSDADKQAFNNNFVQQALEMYMLTMGGAMATSMSSGLSFDRNEAAAILARRQGKE